MLESLLQNARKIYLKMRQFFYCKMRVSLKNVTGAKECDVYYKMLRFSKQRKWSQQQ